MENNKFFEELFSTEHDKITVSPCNTGDVNTSYIVLYDGQKAFVKVQDKPDLPAFYNGQIEREAAGLTICKEKGIPCPSILQYNVEQKYIVTEYYEYPLLSQVWNSFDSIQKADMKQQILDVLQTLNNIESHKFGAIYPSKYQYDDWKDCFCQLMKVSMNDCLAYKSLSKEEAALILEAVNENVFRLGQERAYLNHLDLHWNNIFVEKKGVQYEIAGIIDFGSALYVPKYMDSYRLNGGLFYGTEKFYPSEERPYTIDEHQHFCADILNVIDYYVFLSFTGNANQSTKNRLLNICNRYLTNIRA